jgi:FdhE protein
LEKLRKRIQQIKKKRPGYGAMLDFYLKVRETEEKAKAVLKIEPIRLRKGWKDLLTKEGFPLLEKKDFPLDTESSVSLFQSLCRIGSETNPTMAEQVKKIQEAIENNKLDIKKLLKEGFQDQKIEAIANQLELDKKIFLFLIHNSVRPSIGASVEQLLHEINTDTWGKSSCPICGSLPHLSLLKEEVGKRYLLCSYCGHSWRTDRLSCPFCNNKEQESLHYFYGEGEKVYRIDLCDKCHQYIKTIDTRTIGDEDMTLEDLATLHLDLLASEKGYKRPVPTPWTM